MNLVFLLQAAQDRDRVLDRGLRDEHRLETPRERRVLFDVLAVFVERRGADAMQLAARERGLQQVGSVHRAVRLAGADQRVHFVDEQDDAALGRRHFVEHRLQPLLEFAAIFRAGDQRAHVERQQLLVAQRFRDVAVDDAQREALHDRGLADAGLADQHRIVLGPARKHLHRAADFLVATDHRVELARPGGLGEVAGVFLQRVIGVFGARRIGRAALAQIVDRRVQRLRRHACVGENPARLGALLHRQRDEQALDGDEGIAGLLRDLLGIVEQARRRRREIELPCARTLHFRQFAEREFDLRQRVSRAPARLVDQARGETLLVVEQHLQDMLGRKLLMPLAHSQRLRALHEAARAFRIFLQIHGSNLPYGSVRRPGATWNSP